MTFSSLFGNIFQRATGGGGKVTQVKSHRRRSSGKVCRRDWPGDRLRYWVRGGRTRFVNNPCRKQTVIRMRNLGTGFGGTGERTQFPIPHPVLRLRRTWFRIQFPIPHPVYGLFLKRFVDETVCSAPDSVTGGGGGCGVKNVNFFFEEIKA